jgi:hypothetical protein
MSTQQSCGYSHDKQLKCIETKVYYYIIFQLGFNKIGQLLFTVSMFLSRTISKLNGLHWLVSTENRLQAGLSQKWGSISSKISLCHYVQPASGSHPATYYMGNRGYSLEVQQIRNQTNHAILSTAEDKAFGTERQHSPMCGVMLRKPKVT